jgi:hypothetical protein
MFIKLDVSCTVYSAFLLQRTHFEEQYFSTECSITQGLCQVDIIQNQIRCVTLIWISSK